MPEPAYWSATTHKEDAGTYGPAWVVDMSYGYLDLIYKVDRFGGAAPQCFVWPIRGGQLNNLFATGDLNHDGAIDLADLIIALRVSAGLTTPVVSVDADVNGDKKIGVEEVIYHLQTISDSR